MKGLQSGDNFASLLQEAVEFTVDSKIKGYVEKLLPSLIDERIQNYLETNLNGILKSSRKEIKDHITEELISAILTMRGQESHPIIQSTQPVIPEAAEKEDVIDPADTARNNRLNTIIRVNKEVADKLKPYFRKIMGADNYTKPYVFFKDLVKACAESGLSSKSVGRSFNMLYPNYLRFNVSHINQIGQVEVLCIHNDHYKRFLSKIKNLNESLIVSFFNRPENCLGVSRVRMVKELCSWDELSEYNIKELDSHLIERLQKVEGYRASRFRGNDPRLNGHSRSLTMYRLVRENQ